MGKCICFWTAGRTTSASLNEHDLCQMVMYTAGKLPILADDQTMDMVELLFHVMKHGDDHWIGFDPVVHVFHFLGVAVFPQQRIVNLKYALEFYVTPWPPSNARYDLELPWALCGGCKQLVD